MGELGKGSFLRSLKDPIPVPAEGGHSMKLPLISLPRLLLTFQQIFPPHRAAPVVV